MIPSLFIPGSDYSCTVDIVGPAVSKFIVGDPVCSFFGLGSFAQFIVADQKELFGVPEGCDLVAAGALPVALGPHTWRLFIGPIYLPVLLILSAAGGVGLAAVQIGKVVGAIVVAVASGAEKVQYLKQLRVDHVVDCSSQNLIQSVKDFLKSR